MPEEPPNRGYRFIAACFGVLLAGFLALWIHVVVREFGVVQARGALVKAVELGDVDTVISLIDRIDPTWLGSAEEWTGESSLATQRGFAWLSHQWMNQGHTKGLLTLYKKRIEKDAAYPLSDLIEPLEWFWGQDDRESLEAYFEFLLRLEFTKGNADAENALAQLIGFAERDAGLALMAWEALGRGKNAVDLPDAVIKTAIRTTNFSQVESLDRLLRLMGLLEPVETFVVFDAVPAPSWKSGATWIERTHRILADEGNENVKRTRELLDEKHLSDVSPETPGLFLLKRFFLDSAPSSTGEHREFSPAEIESALAVFDRLPPEGKAGVAQLLDRNIPEYAGHEPLRRWAGEHLRSEWEKQRERFLALSDEETDATWKSVVFNEWLRSAAKHDLADESTAAVMHLHRFRTKKQVSQGLFESGSYPETHPFHLATIGSHWTREGTAPLPAQFSLVLAFAREPSLTPCLSFPNLNQMGYLKANGPHGRSPWYHASAAEFNEALTHLGEPFVDEPLRFLIVPFFHELANNFSVTLQKPEVLAEFQRLAASNDRPGGWLAKDLADLLPRWWCQSKESHDALLAEGGRSYSYDRVNAYLQNRTTPVAARMSYVLGAFDWHMAHISPNHSAKIGASLPYYPATDELVLEFAKEFERGTWSVESIPIPMWERIMRGMLKDPASPDRSEQARNRKSARQALRARLDSYVREKFASPPPPTPGYRLTGLDQIAPFLRIYAMLLHLDEDEQALSALWDEAERTMASPKEVFSYLPGYRGDRSQALGSASADAIVRRYRESGWESVREYVAEMDGTTAYSALSEATSQLNFREWVEFCSKALNLRDESEGPGKNGWDRFCAFPPDPFLKAARNLKGSERIEFFASEFSGVEIPDDHADFFALALPSMIRNCVNRGDSASESIRALTANGNDPVSPMILREFTIACDTSTAVIEARHLDALRSMEIPLAQRWIGSAFFQISRSDRSTYYMRIVEWPAELKTLAEVGVDLLVEALDRKIPVWLLLDRGLGLLDHAPWHPHLTISFFSSLNRLDMTSQAHRASQLMDRERIVELLRDHPNRILLLKILYSFALQMEERGLAVDLFTEAESKLSFEEKLQWLSQGKFHVPMAHLFSRQWRQIGELSLGFSEFAQGEELETILSSLPDDPDLRRLVRATLQHHSMSIMLVNPGSNRIFDTDSTIVNAFLRDQFKSPEMEALCLARLPVRMEQSPQLCAWLDDHLKDRDWKTMLAQNSPSIRREWPYWARKIEALAGLGDFETLAKMLPEATWFANRPRPFDDGYSSDTADTIEEIVWMGFVRPIAHQLRFGSIKDRLDAGAIAARLLAAPPASTRRDKVRGDLGTSSYRSTSFHAEAVHELWLYSIAATLSATLDEPPDVAVARCDKYELPPLRSVVNAPMINGATHQTFFRLLAEFGETMTEDEKESFYLRSFETSPFTRKTITKVLPCYSLARIQLPRQISLDFMARLAKSRSELSNDTAFHSADLGLVLHLAGNDAAALPLLEQAMSLLDTGKVEDLAVLEVINPMHSLIARSAEVKKPTPVQ